MKEQQQPYESPILGTLSSAARRIGVSRRQIERMIASGKFGPDVFKVGRLTKVRANEVDRWALSGCPSRAEWLCQRDSKPVEPSTARPAW